MFNVWKNKTIISKHGGLLGYAYYRYFILVRKLLLHFWCSFHSNKVCFNIPKHTFIFWLAVKSRLITWERLAAWGYSGDILCTLFRVRMESQDHLYFEWSFTKIIRECWGNICLPTKFEAGLMSWVGQLTSSREDVLCRN